MAYPPDSHKSKLEPTFQFKLINQELLNLHEELTSMMDARIYGVSFVKVTYDEKRGIVKKRIDPKLVQVKTDAS